MSKQRFVLYQCLTFFLFIFLTGEQAFSQAKDNAPTLTRHQMIFTFGQPHSLGGYYCQPIGRRFSIRAGGESNNDKGVFRAGLNFTMFDLSKDFLIYSYFGAERGLKRYLALNGGIGNVYYVGRNFVLTLEVDVVSSSALPGDHGAVDHKSVKPRAGFGFSF